MKIQACPCAPITVEQTLKNYSKPRSNLQVFSPKELIPKALQAISAWRSRVQLKTLKQTIKKTIKCLNNI